MPVTGTIRDCIKDPARIDEVYELIEEGRSHYGSQTFDQHLMELVNDDEVDFKVAMAAANNPADFDLKMNTFKDDGGGKGRPGLEADEVSQLFGGR